MSCFHLRGSVLSSLLAPSNAGFWPVIEALWLKEKKYITIGRLAEFQVCEISLSRQSARLHSKGNIWAFMPFRCKCVRPAKLFNAAAFFLPFLAAYHELKITFHQTCTMGYFPNRVYLLKKGLNISEISLSFIFILFRTSHPYPVFQRST